MSGWQFQYDYASSDINVVGSSRNVTGSPLVSASVISEHTAGSRTPIAGIYRFTMVTTSTVKVEIVDSGDTNNPLVYSGTRSVTADGATVNKNLLPGWSIVLASDLDAGDIFEIGSGCYYDSDNGVWERILTLGYGLPGFSTSPVVMKVENTSGYTQTNSKLVATNAARIDNTEAPDRPFFAFRQTGILSPTSHSNLSGKAVTFANFASGSPNTVDILVDGSQIDVYDVTNQVSMPNGTTLKCDGTTVYRFADGTAYQSCEFILSSSLTASDTATIYVSDGGESVELSSAGVSYVAGTTGIDLTEADQVTGTVTDDGEVEFYLRKNISSGEDKDLNLRSFSLRVSSETV